MMMDETRFEVAKNQMVAAEESWTSGTTTNKDVILHVKNSRSRTSKNKQWFKIQVNKVARLGWNDNIRLKTEEHLIRSGFKDVDHLDGGEGEW